MSKTEYNTGYNRDSVVTPKYRRKDSIFTITRIATIAITTFFIAPPPRNGYTLNLLKQLKNDSTYFFPVAYSFREFKLFNNRTIHLDF